MCHGSSPPLCKKRKVENVAQLLLGCWARSFFAFAIVRARKSISPPPPPPQPQKKVENVLQLFMGCIGSSLHCICSRAGTKINWARKSGVGFFSLPRFKFLFFSVRVVGTLLRVTINCAMVLLPSLKIKERWKMLHNPLRVALVRPFISFAAVRSQKSSSPPPSPPQKKGRNYFTTPCGLRRLVPSLHSQRVLAFFLVGMEPRVGFRYFN